MSDLSEREVVHSGLMPSCDNFGNGALIAFTEDMVNCPECRALWDADGIPKFVVRSGESNAQFRARTNQS